MDETAFRNAFAESRNGANHFVRHWANRRFQYSDGVEEVAEAGAYWLLDIVATEVPAALANTGEVQGILEVHVQDGQADILLNVDDDKPPAWKRHIDFTDMPDGKWLFEVVDEGERFAMILITEH
jgi:hypothetical protein